MKLLTVLLAAGESVRFGGNKLLAEYGGQPLVCRVMEAMAALPDARRVAVVSDVRVAAYAASYGMEIVMNDAPRMGQGRSIALGMSAVEDEDAVLLVLGDQPRLSAASLEKLLACYERSDKGMACLRDETHAGNPAVFSRTYFAQLASIQRDRGAKGILRAHAEDLLVVDCLHPHELADADTPQALADLAALG